MIVEEAEEYLEYTMKKEFGGIRPSAKTCRIIVGLIAEVERQKERGKDILLLAHVFRSNHRGARAEVERLRAELAEALGVAP